MECWLLHGHFAGEMVMATWYIYFGKQMDTQMSCNQNFKVLEHRQLTRLAVAREGTRARMLESD